MPSRTSASTEPLRPVPGGAGLSRRSSAHLGRRRRAAGTNLWHTSGGHLTRYGGDGRLVTAEEKTGSRVSLKAVFKRTVAEFSDDGATDLAAALTYYGVLSIFPAILALTSLLGVFGQGPDTTKALLDVALDLGASQEQLEPIEAYINSLQGSGGAGIALFIGLAGALWAASNYVNAFSRAMNTIFDVREGRPVWKLRPVMLLITLVVLLLVVLVALSLALSGGIAQAVFGVIGLGDVAIRVWGIAKWPVLFVIVVGIIALLYWGTPNLKRKFRWFSPGALVAIVVMVVAVAGYGFYVANFGNYSATYGAMAGAILMLLLLWVINVALLFGAEFDAEFERGRQLRAGLPAEEDLQLPPRDDRQLIKKAEKQHELVEENRRIRLEAGQDNKP
ncbi:YihY/virulence factor BrkB family protein [Ornithinimicrobium ciconiae]|uniref:YihY/virulence factor BrkB family protein n=1 Tax=Ornithinimicrobium ciconiae TaxID=2594265 RepID=A0A516GD29_9MICO|nr:YihY/virulence factor BrkB family protein [Ornithinimicrobium ciconiae]